MVSIISGSVIAIVGLGIIFLCLKKESESNKGQKVVGVVIDNKEHVMQDAIHKKFNKTVAMYRAVYEIDTGLNKYTFVDTEILDFPLEKGVEKEFIQDSKHSDKFYNKKSSAKNLKMGALYFFIGILMIFLGVI